MRAKKKSGFHHHHQHLFCAHVVSNPLLLLLHVWLEFSSKFFFHRCQTSSLLCRTSRSEIQDDSMEELTLAAFLPFSFMFDFGEMQGASFFFSPFYYLCGLGGWLLVGWWWSMLVASLCGWVGGGAGELNNNLVVLEGEGGGGFKLVHKYSKVCLAHPRMRRHSD